MTPMFQATCKFRQRQSLLYRQCSQFLSCLSCTFTPPVTDLHLKKSCGAVKGGWISTHYPVHVRTTFLTGFLKVPWSRLAQGTLDSWILIRDEQWIPAQVSWLRAPAPRCTLVAAGDIWLQTSTSQEHQATVHHSIWCEILLLS